LTHSGPEISGNRRIHPALLKIETLTGRNGFAHHLVFVSEAAGGYNERTRTDENKFVIQWEEEPLVPQADTCEESALNPYGMILAERRGFV